MTGSIGTVAMGTISTGRSSSSHSDHWKQLIVRLYSKIAILLLLRWLFLLLTLSPVSLTLWLLSPSL